MSVSAIFFLTDLKGKVLICRNYRGDLPMSVADTFSKHLQEDDEAQLSPIITDEGYTYVYIKHQNIYLMGVTHMNINVMVIFSFLSRFVEVFEDYFNQLNEESIRDNFVLTYELFDEMMDFGYPQISEAKILKDYICVQERHKYNISQPVSIPNSVTGNISRGDNINYKKNEVFLDVIEKVNLLVAANGTVIQSEVLGALKMKTFLSGVPELKLGLNDKLMMDNHPRMAKGKGIEMEDIRFHQCVRLNRFESDRTISFIPPDGECDLMLYRITTPVRPLIWIDARVEKFSHSRIEYMIKAKTNFKKRSTANNVEISIPVPSDADTPAFKTSIGKVDYVPDKDVFIWKIKQFQGQKEYLMRASFGLPSITSDENLQSKAPINVKFEIPYFTVSGIQVRYLKIMEKSGYQALPWVRYITQNGDYQIRMS